jgi:hypothetical protein
VVPSERTLEFDYRAAAHLVLEPRSLELRVAYDKREGVLARVSVAGPDLLVRWFELQHNRALDASSPRDRALAASRAADVLGGMLEARLPAARCSVPADAGVLTRRCDGLEARMRQGSGEGDLDEVVLSVTTK